MNDIKFKSCPFEDKEKGSYSVATEQEPEYK